MIKALAVLAILLPFASAQNEDVLNNEIVMRMVAAGVPVTTIIRTIDAAPAVAFRFLPSDLSELAQARVSEDVVKAMAARSKRIISAAQAPTATPKSALPNASQGTSGTPTTSNQNPSPPAAPGQTIPRPPPPQSLSSGEPGDWRVEVKGSVGANSGPDRGIFPNVSPSYGGLVAIRAKSYLAFTGHYLYNDFGSTNVVFCSGACSTIKVHAKVQEVMGGVRLSAANNSHVSPYASVSAGLANASAGAGTNILGIGISARDSINKFAFAPGGGVNFKVTRRFGLSFDVHYVKMVDATWYVRALGSAFVRF